MEYLIIAVISTPILILLLIMPDSSSEHWEISRDEMMDEAIREINKSE
jgi:hypothetical protein